jgi:hypothetical protein
MEADKLHIYWSPNCGYCKRMCAETNFIELAESVGAVPEWHHVPLGSPYSHEYYGNQGVPQMTMVDDEDRVVGYVGGYMQGGAAAYSAKLRSAPTAAEFARLM